MKELSVLDGVVLSLGGGAVLNEENVACVKQSGTLVYLRATKETLLAHLSGDDSRPLLVGSEMLAVRLERLLAERVPIYERVADCVIDVDDKTPEVVAEEVLKAVNL